MGKNKNKNEEEEEENVERTVVPVFSSSNSPPLSTATAQRFFSGPLSSAAVSPRRSSATSASVPKAFPKPADMAQSCSSKLPRAASQKAKTPPGTSISGPTTGKKRTPPKNGSYEYELRPSPLGFSSSLKEESVSPLILGAAVSKTKTDLFEAYLFLFNFSFGDERTVKKCSADFFNSAADVNPRISAPVKEYFYKLMLKKEFNPIKAKMLLGKSSDERLLPALAENLRYLKEEMPSPKGLDVEAYIEAIANGRPTGKFPYANPEQEKFDFLRYALQQNYNFFEYIFTTHDTSSEEEANTLLKIQRWLYHELSYQAILRENKGILERIRFWLSNDDENKDKDEDEIQVPSKLKVAPTDLQQALHQHLKTLLKRNIPLSTAATKTAFLLVHQRSSELIQQEAEEELNALFDLLLQSPAGNRFLCAVKDDEKKCPVEKWLNLLGNERVCVLFDKILSILLCLNTKQVLALLDSAFMDTLTDRLSAGQQLQFLHKLLELDSPVVNRYICEDSSLMPIAKKNGLVETLRERIWYSFSVEFLTENDEIRRDLFSDGALIVGSKKELAKLLDRPFLNKFLLERFHNINVGINKSSIRDVWVGALKTIWRLVLNYWRPSDDDLSKISDIEEQWRNTMIKKSSDNCSVYDPQHYRVDKLPHTMQAALEGSVEVLKLYQEQLEIMADYHRRLLDCVAVPYNEADTSSSALENHISFSELIRTLATQTGMEYTEEQIQACAEDLSGWFKEAISTGEVYSFESMFSGLTKNNSGTADVLYLSTQYVKAFLERLEKAKAMSKKSLFSLYSRASPVLKEKETKGVIDEFLRTLIKEKVLVDGGTPTMLPLPQESMRARP